MYIRCFRCPSVSSMNSPVHGPVTEQGRTIRAASAATELSVRKKPFAGIFPRAARLADFSHLRNESIRAELLFVGVGLLVNPVRTEDDYVRAAQVRSMECDLFLTFVRAVLCDRWRLSYA
jgi:hypothetical protein